MYVCRLFLHIGLIRMDLDNSGVTWDLNMITILYGFMTPEIDVAGCRRRTFLHVHILRATTLGVAEAVYARGLKMLLCRLWANV
jgi:hypothetical protein